MVSRQVNLPDIDGIDQLDAIVKKAVLKGLHANGDRIFELSQKYVPKRELGLFNSGYIKKYPQGFEIGYTAPYAARIEEGGEEIPFVGVQKVDVREHRRKGHYRNGHYVRPTIVKAHVVKYSNQRLIGFVPAHRKRKIYRVMKAVPAIKGRFFLARAFREGLAKLDADIAWFLINVR